MSPTPSAPAAKPAMPQIQKSADAIARAISSEIPKLNPVDRRELLVQTIQWIRGRVTALDEARARSGAGMIAIPTPEETRIATGAFGKGSRSSDGTSADRLTERT